MWGAIKNDLFEFITTVQEDTQQTLSKVVDLDPSFSRTEEDEEKISEEEKKLSEFRNNFATYSEDVEMEHKPEFEKFLKTFSLSTKAEEIEYILEQECGILKHYEALVPQELTPDIFWARYFFKVNILILSSLDSVLESAYDEEEELTWGDDEDNNANAGEEGKQDESGVDKAKTSVPLKSDETEAIALSYDGARRIHASVKLDKSHCQESTETIDKSLLNATKEVSALKETNNNLSTRVILLEEEVEKLQNQLTAEKEISTKLRAQLNEANDREKNLLGRIDGLKLKVSAAEGNHNAYENTSAPLSTGSGSVVDLGEEICKASSKSQLPPQTSTQLGPSVSDLSLASLQSISSVSTNSSPSTNTDLAAPSRSTDKPSCNVNTKANPANNVLDEEEEEWDNEAWE